MPLGLHRLTPCALLGVKWSQAKVVADPKEKPMAPDRLSSLVGVCAASLAIALSLPPTASADPPSWNGEYAITFIVGPKSGTSMAAGHPEVQYTDTYGFRSSCTSGKCTATIISGPPPRNPTVPQPVQFTWDGSSWTQVSDFQWDCMMPDDHDPMESGPSRRALHAPTRRITFRHHAHRDLERRVPGHA